MSNLSLRGISKSYRRGTVKALDAISLDFSPGIYGVLGPNGAGKSSLFKILATVLPADSGTLIWKGRDVREQLRAYKKSLAYMPQQQELYPEMTGRQFLEYMALLKEIPRRQIPSEIERAAAACGMNRQLGKACGKYSGGMKQRILISQAILGKPELMILDEPTAGLDPLERIRIRKLIARLARDRIILIATHVVSDVACVAKNLLLLDKGRVLYSGPPSALLARYDRKVWDGVFPLSAMDEAVRRFRITQLREVPGERIYIRICGDFDQGPACADIPFQLASPSLEDVYLYVFGEPQE